MIEQGGDYALALKGNQGTLRDNVHLFRDDPAAPLAQDVQISEGHGRIETRIASVSADVAWLQETHHWPGLCMIGQRSCRGQSDRRPAAGRGRERTEPLLPAERSVLGGTAQLHCAGTLEIENRLRRVLDVTCHGDQARNRKGRCAEKLALLRKLALNLVRLEASKCSMRGKLKWAGWDDGFRISILSQFTKIHMR